MTRGFVSRLCRSDERDGQLRAGASGGWRKLGGRSGGRARGEVADANPHASLLRVDTQRKLAVLLPPAFGVAVSQENIPMRGTFGFETGQELSWRRRGYRIKLAAQAWRLLRSEACPRAGGTSAGSAGRRGQCGPGRWRGDG